MIKGFDASHTDEINWETISPDFKFCIIKKSEGATFTDPYYGYRSKYLPTSGLIWDDYHFMKPNISIESQLDNYFFGRKATLPPILDAEVPGITPTMVQEWLTGAQERTGKRPILYCDPGFYKDNLKSTQFDCYYWIAAWQPEPPHIHWDIWQYSQYGRQDGTHGNNSKYGSLDLDYFNGTIEQLANL
jgi:lysozyme